MRIAQPDDASPGTSTHPLAGLRQALALQPVIIGPDRSTSTRQLGRRRYELTDHLGNVRVVFGDRKLSDFDPQNTPIPTHFSAEVMAYADYDPFGSLLPGRYAPGDQAGYRFGFNGKEKDDEIHDDPGTSYDFGSRIHDPRVGRWLSLDPLSSSYPGISSYSFALNTPIQGKDADGNVVIFINGIHGGTGGSKAYWGQYAIDVKNRLGDQSARYVDGALGGWGNTGFRATQGGFSGSGFGPLGSLIGAALHVKTSSNVNRDVRIAAGRAQGINDAADIIANLQEGETIKVVTHSMGTAFARGYTEGIMAYARENGLEGKVKFEYELDVNAFQGGDLPADPNVALSQYKLGGMDGGKWDELKRRPLNSVPSVAAIPGAEPISTPSDATKGHAVTEMSTDLIPTLGNGGAARDIEQGNNNEGAP